MFRKPRPWGCPWTQYWSYVQIGKFMMLYLHGSNSQQSRGEREATRELHPARTHILMRG